ncbi:hypothetical protein [Nocardioides yefusunii]|uniref:Uncharacterized protein n=1 Tax=Nocardioides yefusunii TaxID=2500546 RepID=A0ABW1QVR7_9ACTN
MASLTAVSMVGLTPVALSGIAVADDVTPTSNTSPTTSPSESPAPAPAPLATRATLRGSSYSSELNYGTSGFVYADLHEAASGRSVFETGTMRLQQSVAGGAWTTTGLSAPGGYRSFEVKPKATTRYRIVFSGGTNRRGVAFAPSTSAPVTYTVTRTGKYSGSRVASSP